MIQAPIPYREASVLELGCRAPSSSTRPERMSPTPADRYLSFSSVRIGTDLAEALELH